MATRHRLFERVRAPHRNAVPPHQTLRLRTQDAVAQHKRVSHELITSAKSARLVARFEF